jgi:hypothetical protein
MRPYLKNKLKAKTVGYVAHVVEELPNELKVLRSNSSTVKKQNQTLMLS